MTVGLLLAAAIVVLLLLMYDESRYRTCIESGGVPAGKEFSVGDAIDNAFEGEPEECSRRSPF